MTTPQNRPAPATGLVYHMTRHRLDAVDLQLFLEIDAKSAHAIYRGRELMTLNQLGAVSKWLRVMPHELLYPAFGQAPA